MAATAPDLVVVPLDESHRRAGFTCGVASLDTYFQSQAGPDVRRRANGVFVLAEPTRPETVLGYYTLCATALPPGVVPEAARKHIPRYPLVSATLIGRLAIATDRQGQRLGAILLADALRRAFATAGTVGSSMIVVDALDDRTAAFYAAHGFVRLPESLRLVMPMRAVGRLMTDVTMLLLPNFIDDGKERYEWASVKTAASPKFDDHTYR